MGNTVQATIQQIDDKITKLQQLRADLVQEFLTSGEPTVPVKPANGKNRRQVIMDFIVQHGPSTRKELIQGTGIPVGTISFVLNDKKTFKSVNGKWTMVKSRG